MNVYKASMLGGSIYIGYQLGIIFLESPVSFLISIIVVAVGGYFALLLGMEMGIWMSPDREMSEAGQWLRNEGWKIMLSCCLVSFIATLIANLI